jgi:hypothetical protein
VLPSSLSRPLLALAAAAVAFAGAPAAASAADPVTVRFDELPRQPADGLGYHGVTFRDAFATYNQSGIDFNPALGGSTGDGLTLEFDLPTTRLSFGLDVISFYGVGEGREFARVELFTPQGASRGSFPINSGGSGHSGYDWHFYVDRGGFSYTGEAIGSAKITFVQGVPPHLSGYFLDNLGFTPTTPDLPPNTIANGDFETGDLSGWTANGSAFAVTRDSGWGWGGPFNPHRANHVWGFKAGGDAATGELRSQTWSAWGNPYVDFLIGGGEDIDNLYVALVVDGVEVRKATGTNDERYRRVIWDMRPYAGKRAYFKVVDRATGGWGHLNVDDFHTEADSIASNAFKALPNYDFDSGLDGWTANGAAFSAGDVTSEGSWWGGSFDQHGANHLWGYRIGGDDDHGTLRSAPFVLGGTGKVDFLIGGGRDPEHLYMALVRAADGQRLFTETGADSERYRRVRWDASAFIGETLYVEAVDARVGGWGHVNLDDVNVQVRQ